MRQEEPDKEIHDIFELRSIGIIHCGAHRHAGRDERAEQDERALPEAAGVHHAKTGEEPLQRRREQARLRINWPSWRDQTWLGASRHRPIADRGAGPWGRRDAARRERRSRDDARSA